MLGEWIRNPKTATTVVFVHGILSSGETCWRHENGSYWPELLKKQPDLDDLGIYVFTYNTAIFSGNYRLGDVVDALKEHMRLDKVLKSDRLIFVCHSMGGIVVRKLLVERASELIETNIGIGLFLIASPSLGSSYANWLEPLARLFGHAQAEALRFAQNNAWLNDLDKEFSNLKEANKLRITGKELIEDSFVFLRRFFRRQVVEPFSGARYFGEAYKVPRSDHFSIAKPEDAEAIQHRLLCAFLNTMLQPYAVHSKSKYRLQSTPDIVLNELQKRGIDTGGIRIAPGFNIHDLKKRIEILNAELSRDKINALAETARDVAFSSKYAEPREDEKLVSIRDLGIEGIREWHFYLLEFLSDLDISEVEHLKVLDVGIGNAYASHVFLSRCANLTGVDVSQEALGYAEQKLPNAKLQIGTAEDLRSIESFSIDLYVSLRTYQSTLFDIKESLHEAFRVLAKGGGIVISVPVMFLKWDDSGHIASVLRGLIPQGSTVPSLEYARQIGAKVSEYLGLLGFRDVKMSDKSPFEIYVGARK